MLSSQNIAVIGAGNIGQALIGGLLRGGGVSPSQIRATRRNPDAVHLLEDRFPGIDVGTDNELAVKDASIVVLAIKPQNARTVLTSLIGKLPRDVLFISTLAGITTDVIVDALNKDIAVVRTMPNTPALVDEGATAIAAGRFANDRHLGLARAIFEAVGKVEEVPEYLMDAVTGLSGSGPAYIYMVIEALTDGGVKQGLPRPTALRLAAQTVLGAAKLVIETGRHPAILRDEVTTPGGTAIAAVAELESHGLRTMLINAVATATQRSRELSNPSD
ncbi:MAG TPA: pyrroline-5-carboxylate reductase [Rhodothermales bacterium]|nr:pyrroline-5-carboxylate reductase [Rhodothermales bacterium]